MAYKQKNNPFKSINEEIQSSWSSLANRARSTASGKQSTSGAAAEAVSIGLNAFTDMLGSEERKNKRAEKKKEKAAKKVGEKIDQEMQEKGLTDEEGKLTQKGREGMSTEKRKQKADDVSDSLKKQTDPSSGDTEINLDRSTSLFKKRRRMHGKKRRR